MIRFTLASNKLVISTHCHQNRL